MGVTLQRDEGDVRVVRISGLLRKSEMDAALVAEAREWGPATRIKALLLVQDFEGFERGAGWEDISFLVKHDHQIEKIAIVGDAKWEGEMLAFVGAGFRQGQVRVFAPNQLAQARAWLG
jgi:stage II sporulation SpoAA-like protein